MANTFMLVGRLVEYKGDNEIVLSVARCFKNIDGEYEKDNVPIEIWEGIKKNIKEYCNINDVMAVRGRVQVKDGKVNLIAEKVTFLNSSKKDDEIVETQ